MPGNHPMRISIPNIISNGTYTPILLPTTQTIQRLVEFLDPSKGTAVLTGAGVSVDSGIRAYRGSHGRYINPNYKPILYQELIDKGEKGVTFRKRYWVRSYLGYPLVRDTKPNTSHTAIAAGMHGSIFKKLITQNVDGLHVETLKPFWDTSRIKNRILELHGTLFRVHCEHGHTFDRDEFQNQLSESNPKWQEFVDELGRTGQKLRTNPDGDVVLEGATYDDFVVPDCRRCLANGRTSSMLKPDLVFFGESIRDSIKDRSFRDVEECDRLLVIGTTLATYSAFRIVKRALELKKAVFVLNAGPTRADGLPGIEKVDGLSGNVLPEVVRTLLGSNVVRDPTLSELLSSGVVRPPPNDLPKATG